MTISSCLKLIAAVAAGCLTGVTHANAYSYKILQYGLNSRVAYVHMHTVSAFCRDVEWSEASWPIGKPIDLSSQSICLVDSVDVRTENGVNFHWGAPVGVTSSWFLVQYDGNNNPTITQKYAMRAKARAKRRAKE